MIVKLNNKSNLFMIKLILYNKNIKQHYKMLFNKTLINPK